MKISTGILIFVLAISLLSSCEKEVDYLDTLDDVDFSCNQEGEFKRDYLEGFFDGEQFCDVAGQNGREARLYTVSRFTTTSNEITVSDTTNTGSVVASWSISKSRDLEHLDRFIQIETPFYFYQPDLTLAQILEEQLTGVGRLPLRSKHNELAETEGFNIRMIVRDEENNAQLRFDSALSENSSDYLLITEFTKKDLGGAWFYDLTFEFEADFYFEFEDKFYKRLEDATMKIGFFVDK